MNEQTDTKTPTRPGRFLLWFGVLILPALVLMLALPAVRQYRSVAWVEARGGEVAFKAGWMSACLPDHARGWLADRGVLSGIETMYAVNLAGTHVGDADLAQLAGVRSLERLFLCGTEVGDASLAHLENMSSLKVLSLNQTQVSDDGLVHLKRMSSLDLLAIHQTEVSEAGKAVLQKALPRTTIMNGRP